MIALLKYIISVYVLLKEYKMHVIKYQLLVHIIKYHLLMKLKMLAPWKKSYDQLGQPLKSRDIILPAKVHLVKAIVFLVVMYGCESWTIKKAELGRSDAFELWCWRGLLDCKEIQSVHPKGNQS